MAVSNIDDNFPFPSTSPVLNFIPHVHILETISRNNQFKAAFGLTTSGNKNNNNNDNKTAATTTTSTTTTSAAATAAIITTTTTTTIT